MKSCALIVVILLVAFVVSVNRVYSQSSNEYFIQLDASGATTWIIKRTFAMNATYDDLDTFQNKVKSLLQDAVSVTSRNMTATVYSVTSTLVGSYVTAEYEFRWDNFAETEDTNIIIGDVFQVPGFFLKLYGDGKVQINYPPQYIVEKVSPSPSKYDSAAQILEWPGNADFGADVRIVLKTKTSASGLVEALEQNAFLIDGLAMIGAGSCVVIFILRRNKWRVRKTSKELGPPDSVLLDSDEERVVKLLKSKGGNIYQSAITDNLRFSRAKTSQLLSTLERNGVVKRYKKGRDKIVVLVKDKRKPQ